VDTPHPFSGIVAVAAAVPEPVFRVFCAFLLPPGPSVWRPEFRPTIAAILDKSYPLPGGDRRLVQLERRDGHAVFTLLVVIAMTVVRSHDERAAWDRDHFRFGNGVQNALRFRVRKYIRLFLLPNQLQQFRDCLLVLALVLQGKLPGIAIGNQRVCRVQVGRVERLQSLLARQGEKGFDLLSRGQVNTIVLRVFRQVGEKKTERVVQRRKTKRVGTHPELLCHTDMPEVPPDRTVEIVDAHLQEVVRDALQQPEGLLSGLFQSNMQFVFTSLLIQAYALSGPPYKRIFRP